MKQQFFPPHLKDCISISPMCAELRQQDSGQIVQAQNKK
jgi:hypothetical protein